MQIYLPTCAPSPPARRSQTLPILPNSMRASTSAVITSLTHHEDPFGRTFVIDWPFQHPSCHSFGRFHPYGLRNPHCSPQSSGTGGIYPDVASCRAWCTSTPSRDWQATRDSECAIMSSYIIAPTGLCAAPPCYTKQPPYSGSPTDPPRRSPRDNHTVQSIQDTPLYITSSISMSALPIPSLLHSHSPSSL